MNRIILLVLLAIVGLLLDPDKIQIAT